MKKLMLALVLSCAVTSILRSQHLSPNDILLFSYFKGNGEDGLHLAYSTDGYKWTALNNDSSFLKPSAGKDKLMRDPCIIKGKDGLFHMVWTVSWNEKGIGYSSSADLINWTKQLYIPVMEMEGGTRNCWAPEIYFDHRRSEYVIYWASTIPGRFPLTEGKAEDKYNHRMYYTTTKNFKSFKKAKLLYDPGFNVIDATIIKNSGQYIMFLKDETLDPVKKNLRIAYSKNATGPYSEAGAPITDSWVEGPTVIKIHDQWIVYFDRYRDGKMGAIRSSDLKNWMDISEQLSFPDGVRHGTVLKISKEEFEILKNQR